VRVASYLEAVGELVERGLESVELHVVFEGRHDVDAEAGAGHLAIDPHHQLAESDQVVHLLTKGHTIHITTRAVCAACAVCAHLMGVAQVGVLDPYLLAVHDVGREDGLKVAAQLALLDIDQPSLVRRSVTNASRSPIKERVVGFKKAAVRKRERAGLRRSRGARAAGRVGRRRGTGLCATIGTRNRRGRRKRGRGSFGARNCSPHAPHAR
jgi:hypothetical protein